ncbi:subclass B3 metallo-beta-lactamase [Pseudoxanthomonas sp. PXM04]|uniref:subclass B3 metallo-beta-lactamase n=1 Tax=Pseudoxanthomonas sp. PXM04 TaxID=2769297 RepID=UPI001786D586|nr:subclass B3 metallo-beta-lactamase [Pseudoxanthomonas sp. PXM04]MBD9377632.1 subclass B3 metallo-beta-lactamase [Pseudoxanthomonas sp. PXM04]
MAQPVLAHDPPEWSEPAKPFHIASNVYYVGTQGLAAYLIKSDEGAILLDATLAENASQIERNIESLGVPLREVKLLLSDHTHADHVGAMAQLKRDTGARFLASEGDRWALENGRNEGDNNYGVMPFDPIPVDEVISDGQQVRLGDVVLTAHLTPGHTRGCTSWSMTVDDRGTPRQVLFLCSITVAGNTLVGNQAYPGIADDYRATFAKLAAMRADIVLTSHPEMADVLERAARRDAGDPDAFVEPGLLSTLVKDFKAAFEDALKEQEAGKRP